MRKLSKYYKIPYLYYFESLDNKLNINILCHTSLTLLIPGFMAFYYCMYFYSLIMTLGSLIAYIFWSNPIENTLRDIKLIKYFLDLRFFILIFI
jgi:hypothetical protein